MPRRRLTADSQLARRDCRHDAATRVACSERDRTGADRGRRAVDHRCGGDRPALRGLRDQRGRDRSRGDPRGRGVRPGPRHPRHHAAGRRRPQRRPQAARPARPAARDLPVCARRHRRQGGGPLARGRLRREAVQPRGAGGARARGAAADARRRRQGAGVRRRRARRGHLRGAPRRGPDRADADGVLVAAVLPPEPAAGAVEAPDPRPRLAVRLRRRREHRRDVRLVPAPQARPARPAPDPHGAPRRLRAAGRLMRFRSLQTRLVAITVALAAVGLAVAGVATYAALRSFLIERVDRTLAASAPGVGRALTRGGPGAIGGLGQAGALTPRLYVAGRDPNGRQLFGPALTPPRQRAETPTPPSSISAPAGPYVVSVPANGGGSGFRVRAEQLPFGLGTLILAAPLADTDATLDRLAMIEALVAAGVLITIAILGALLIRRGLRPLQR